MTPADDPFARIAPFYDLDLEGYDDDLTMYRELAATRGQSVLELGCGTGRVAASLAEAGFEVVGVDASEAMLDHARERAGGTLTLMHADMRTLDLARLFEVVLIPLGGLQHMESASDVAATLATVARHVVPGGVAVVDVETAQAEDLMPGPQPLVQHWSRPWRGGSVTKLVAVEGEPSRGRRRVVWHFDVQPPEGPLRRVSSEFMLRTITAGELELAARLAALAVSQWYGGYQLTPPADGDERLVAVLEHAS